MELATIPVLGFQALILSRHSRCNVFILNEATGTDTDVALGIFVAFLTECAVDLFSSYIERSQGIKMETWLNKIKLRQLLMITLVLMSGLGLNLYLLMDTESNGTCANDNGVSEIENWSAMNTTNTSATNMTG